MGIDYLLFLQNIREASQGLTAFMNAVTHLGGSTLSLIIIAITYWCIDKKIGVRIGIALAIGNTSNQLIKNICCINRPWIIDSRIKPDPTALVKATGYSFPSGHSQTAMSIYGTLAACIESIGWKVIFFIIPLLVAFSRNFLGVHTPRDIAVGLVIGLVSVFISGKLLDWIETKRGRDIIFSIVMIIITALFLAFTTLKPYVMIYEGDALVVNPDEMITDCYKIAGIISGICIGWPIEKRYIRFSNRVDIKTRIIRAFLGIALVASVSLACGIYGSALGMWAGGFIESFVPVIVVIVIWPATFTYIEKRVRR